MQQARVVLRGVSFAFGDGAEVLSSVDLSLTTGWTGLVGPNGSGKSTLLALVAGRLAPDAGTLEVRGRVLWCTQESGTLDPTVRALAERDDREAHRLRASLALDIGGLARWPTLSPGERRRWQIGAAIADAPDVLLLDEPTNHLDSEGRARLSAALSSFRGVGVLVSHDRGLLDAITTRTVRLERGGARALAGAYSEAREAWLAEERAAREERERRKEALHRAERALDQARRTQVSAERSRSARARMRSKHDSDARSALATGAAMRAEASAGRTVTRRHAEAARVRDELEASTPIERARGRELAIAHVVAPRAVVLFADIPELCAGERVILRDVRLSLGRGERVRLAGPNGAGKTTLLARLVPDDPRVLWVPQELAPERIQRELASLRALPSEARGRALSLIAALGADAARMVARGAASPGEARQLVIALALARGVHTAVLDEPTNHLDLPAIERLEHALAAFPGALLLVTHDDALAARTTTREWRIEGQHVR